MKEVKMLLKELVIQLQIANRYKCGDEYEKLKVKAFEDIKQQLKGGC